MGVERRHTTREANTKLNLALVTGLALCAGLAKGADCALDWSTVDGGDGTSTDGVYAVSGTVGQPDPGAMSGGTYTLSGGFWGIIAVVQTPDAPLLSIPFNSQLSTITVSWPLPADGWVLEWTKRVADVSAPWPQVSPPHQTNTTQAWIVEPWPTGNRFHRLHKT